MKLPSPIFNSARDGRRCQWIRRPAPRLTLHAQQGVALVVTLILLAIITFMAITFLVLSHAERKAVGTSTDQTQARLAAEAAQQQAVAQVLGSIMATTNEFAYELTVSTNFVNPAGFINGNPNIYTNPVNVSYSYLDGTPLTGKDALQNIANLLYNPRPPVFLTNRLFASSNDFRYYLDLNRNGLYETNGFLPWSGNGPSTNISFFVGDPEWVGKLEFPDRPHSAENPFVSRFAYVVVPAGKALDVNLSHNQANLVNRVSPTIDPLGSDYLRNQGVGTFEINLASFLYDLNTNLYAWGGLYTYDPLTPYITAGNAFADACSLVQYRYSGLNNLPSVAGCFTNGAIVSLNDYVDGYAAGPIMTNFWHYFNDPDNARVARSWSGANNTNHFFTTQELFDPAKSSTNFVNRLFNTGTRTNFYDRYTFYRLLSQLGTDSAPEAGKINVNYKNVDNRGNIVPTLATNFVAWEPLEFFNNSANRILLNAGFNFTTTNTQIYPTNFYTPSVHQMLQLAANIYDSSATNRSLGILTATNGFPTVFRPLFRRAPSGQILIAGYREVVDAGMAYAGTAPQMVYLGTLSTNSIPMLGQVFDPLDRNEPMVAGFPLVIGAKKGFPNFNELGMETQVQVTRKLEFRRENGSNTGAINETNEMYVVSITNSCGVEAWNSYRARYPRDLQAIMSVDMFAVVSNEFNLAITPNKGPVSWSLATNLPAGWPGFSSRNTAGSDGSFKAWTTHFLFMTNMTYSETLRTFTNLSGAFERNLNPRFRTPYWLLKVQARLRFILVDTLANRIVDYVNLDAPQDPVDISFLLTRDGQCDYPYQPNGDKGNLWCTNRIPQGADENAPTFGILNQIKVSLGDITSADQWPIVSERRKDEVDFFRAQFPFKGLFYHPLGTYSTTNIFDAPFSPTRRISFYTRLQANDPLVHYTVPDLTDLISQKATIELDQTDDSPMPGVGGNNPINGHYRPWGGDPDGQDTAFQTDKDMSVKDPVISTDVTLIGSDNWDFPTNKFPNIGWLGRVHRGTPWQTVYLKSLPINSNWWRWTGNSQIVTNLGQIATNLVPLYISGTITGLVNDALFSYPTSDRAVLDLFTASFSDSATRGQLSINQSGLAAWSAVLGGVNVLSNINAATGFIEPAKEYDPYDTNAFPALLKIVNGINNTRTNYQFGVFHHLGDVLATPELTVNSPYLFGDPSLMNDAVYERIPQQILGLLQCDHVPRFVVYSYGQTLKPAPRSLVTSGQYIGLCTNYQITAEVATRAVVRIEGAPTALPLGASIPAFTNLHAVIESFNVLPPD